MEAEKLRISDGAVIAVIADTHGRKKLIQPMLDRFGAAALIHLGDHAADSLNLSVPAFAVRGNCDFSSIFPNEMLIDIGESCECRVFVTHGHLYGVKGGPLKLLERAKALGASMALYGHTHIADMYKSGSILAANPGSLSEPRAMQPPSFGVLKYSRGRLEFEIVQDIR